MSKNKFLIDKYDKLMVDIKMYMCEISKFKISDLKPQKMTTLWTLKHVSAISKHPVYAIYPDLISIKEPRRFQKPSSLLWKSYLRRLSRKIRCLEALEQKIKLRSSDRKRKLNKIFLMFSLPNILANLLTVDRNIMIKPANMGMLQPILK